MNRLILAICLIIPSSVSLSADNWPQFRGPGSLGTAENQQLPLHWSASENIAWRTTVAGRGWSSPVVWGDRVFLTSVVNDADTEAAKPGLYFGGERPEPPESKHLWKVICFDLKSGQQLWEQTAHEGTPQTGRHIKNSYASETPATDGERIYAYFGNQGVYCYTLDGKPVWGKALPSHKTRNEWGTAASPIVYDGRLFLVNDNDDESYIVALDAKTGDELWRQPRDEKTNWATPFIWKTPDRVELVTAGTNKVRSYDLDGKLLWELGGMSSIAIPTPFAHDGLLYLASGYIMDKQKPVFAIKPGATGDITPKEGETSGEYIAWFQQAAGPYNPSPVLYKDKLYVLLDRGMLACYDAKTGEVEYEKQRIPGGRAFTASPWAYRDKIFCLNEFGTTFVIQAGPKFELLYTNELGEDVMCMASPAIVGDRLLIRTDKELLCIAESSASNDQAASP